MDRVEEGKASSGERPLNWRDKVEALAGNLGYRTDQITSELRQGVPVCTFPDGSQFSPDPVPDEKGNYTVYTIGKMGPRLDTWLKGSGNSD